MKVTIENAMTLAGGEVEMESGQVTLLCGPNMKGKTSAITAIGGVLARDMNPVNLPASASKEYLRDGQDSGFVAVNDDEIVWNLKSSDIAIAPEAPPAITQAAAGLVDFMSISGKERVAVYERLFLPPEKVLVDRLRAELAAHLDTREIDGVIDVIAANGWEGVDNVYADRGRRSKRNWQGITGKTYGTKVAVDWLPDNWQPAYDGLSLEDCERALEEARIVLKGLEVARVILQSDVDRGKRAAEELPELERELREKQKPLDEARREAQEAVKAYNAIREDGRSMKQERDAYQRSKPQVDDPLECPHCGGKVAVHSGGRILKFDEEAVAAAMEEWKANFADLSDTLEMQSAKLAAADQRRLDADAKAALLYNEMEPLRDRIAIAKRDAVLASESVAEEDSDAVSEAEEAVERLVRQKGAVATRLNAHREHENVVSYTHIASLLGAKGVRAQAMKTMMGKLDQFLGVVADQTGWPRVKLALDYSVKIGHRSSARLCSESEKWRAQVSLQIAIARMKRDAAIIIDRGDILDDDARHELHALIDFLFERKDPPALLVAATWTREGLPGWVDGLAHKAYRITSECRIVTA